MILLLIGLSTFTIGLSHASSCHSLQQSQLASLNERMNQMISALYTAPFSKNKSSGATYQTTTPAPPTEYSTQVAQYDPSYYNAYQSQQSSTPAPQVYYMSQQQSQSPTTVAISPPAPGSPPTVTISSTRMPSPCYPQYEGQEYAYPPAPKSYPPQYYEFSYAPQYGPSAPYPPAPQPYMPAMECTCQFPGEYPVPPPVCPCRQAYGPPPERARGCPPPCQPPPACPPAPYPQPPVYPPPACSPPPAYPPPPSYPPSPAYGPPPYPYSGPQYPPPPTYNNPHDAMQGPLY